MLLYITRFRRTWALFLLFWSWISSSTRAFFLRVARRWLRKRVNGWAFATATGLWLRRLFLAGLGSRAFRQHGLEAAVSLRVHALSALSIFLCAQFVQFHRDHLVNFSHLLFAGLFERGKDQECDGEHRYAESEQFFIHR